MSLPASLVALSQGLPLSDSATADEVATRSASTVTDALNALSLALHSEASSDLLKIFERNITKTPPSARGSESRERERKAAEPRRASVERPHSKPPLAPRQAKQRGSVRRCFVIGGRSFCE